MTKSLLLVTPQTSLGIMLRSSLEETGQFRVFIAGDEPTALVQLKSEECEMVFLDVDLGMDAVLEIGNALRTVSADLGLVIVSDEELPPALDALRPWSLLRKPFYLPELLAMLEVEPVGDKTPALVVESIPESPMPSGGGLPWLQDVNKAAQRLTRLTLESSAQAALITRGKTLWAYAGGLSQETANELVHIITRNWDEQKDGDLLRFARLETTHADHMLYASTLAEGMVLALVFDAETPFSTIRSQANSLAHSLAVEKTGSMKPVTPEPDSSTHDETPLLPEDEDSEPISISDIINDIPTPNPAVRSFAHLETSVDATPEAKKTEEDHSVLETRPSEPLAETRVVSRESSPPISMSGLMSDETVKHEAEELDATVLSKAKRPSTPVRIPQPGELDETRPHSITEVAGRTILEPISAAMYHLNYACLLVPRFTSHYLTGDVATRLSEWLPNICVAFGWRLEFMAVRPEYLQWVVNVPPNTSPGYLMRIMRQQTSEKIFVEFTRLKREIPSGDFWAPGYLIMGGVQPHPQQLVKDYIKQIRQRQGASQPRK